VGITNLVPFYVGTGNRACAIVPRRNICRCLLHVDIGAILVSLSYVGYLLGNSLCREGFVPELLHRRVCVFKGGYMCLISTRLSDVDW